MNGTQFWTLIGISSLTVILVITEICLALNVQSYQTALEANVPTIQKGQQLANVYNQVVSRIYQVGQQTHDQRLMDLLARQGVTLTMPPALSPSSSTDSSAPLVTPTPNSIPQSPR